MRAPGELLPPSAEPERGGWWWKVWRAGAPSALVVSESQLWRTEMAELLEADGYAVWQDTHGDAALDPVCPFDIAIVDLGITKRSAVAVFAALRARSPLPILAVAPGGQREAGVLAAYAAGADQLVPRTARQHELLARVRALLRHSPPRARVPSTTAEPALISLDSATGVATVAGVPVPLSTRDAEILEALLERPGRVVTRDHLRARIRSQADARLLDSYVRSVRSKLEEAEGCRRIVAVRGVGFRLLLDGPLEPGPRDPQSTATGA